MLVDDVLFDEHFLLEVVSLYELVSLFGKFDQLRIEHFVHDVLVAAHDDFLLFLLISVVVVVVAELVERATFRTQQVLACIRVWRPLGRANAVGVVVRASACAQADQIVLIQVKVGHGANVEQLLLASQVRLRL